MPTLSVIIITRNEASNIADCINSISFADEIIVVDSNSEDTTPTIAKALGAKLIQTAEWPGFGPQKNFALSFATSDWVLSIDADERVSESLKSEILQAVNNPAFDSYQIPRLSSFLGHFISHSGWYPDYVLRLFKKDGGEFSDSLIHEKFIPRSDRVGHLRNHLIHYSYITDSDYLRKLEQYSSLGALAAYNNKKKSSLFITISHALWAFIKSYFIKLGFLDGTGGLLVAISSAESTYHKYLKLMMLHKK